MPVKHIAVRKLSFGVAVLLASYLSAAYLLLPETWTVVDRNVDVSPASMVTRTSSDIPGDPINVGLEARDTAAVLQAFALAGWDTADAVTLRTAVEIGVSVLFDRPYPDAPVSPLRFDGRRQDLAFEKPVGESADRRHHVRFWRTSTTGPDGKGLWLGSASFDRGVGLSHDTGQITHHIDPDIDAERDGLIQDLKATGQVVLTYKIPGIGLTKNGRNGGGDLYFTDGNVVIGRLVDTGAVSR